MPPPEETMWRERIAQMKPSTPLDQVVATLGLGSAPSRLRPPDPHRKPADGPETEQLTAYFVAGGSVFIRYDGSDPAKKIIGIDFFRGAAAPESNLASWDAANATIRPSN